VDGRRSGNWHLDEKSLVLVSTSGVIAALAVEKVNEKLPKEEQIEPLGCYFSKTLRLHREYRRRPQLMQIRQCTHRK
jgi:hypothetical protein